MKSPFVIGMGLFDCDVILPYNPEVVQNDYANYDAIVNRFDNKAAPF